MAKNNYYAVKKGKITGIFSSWTECHDAINGFPNAEFKGFVTLEEAQAYLNEENIYLKQIQEDIRTGYVVAYTDGSYDQITNQYAYGVCIFDTDGKEIHLCSKVPHPPFASSKNISGEIFGVLTALDWAVSNGYEKIKIYHDLENISKWASGEYSTNSEVSKYYVSKLSEKFNGCIHYEFVKVPGHSNNPYNDKADSLALSALRGKKKMIQKANFFTVSNFEKNHIDTIIQLIQKDDDKIIVDRKKILGGEQVKLKKYNDSTMIKIYDNKKLLVQGQPNTIYQIVLTYVSELLGEDQIISLVKQAYRIKVDTEAVEVSYSNLCSNIPNNYPISIKTLLRQAVINLNGYFQAEEYGQYVFPALRALEGHLKYLFGKHSIQISGTFKQFEGNPVDGYTLKSKYKIPNPDHDNIEQCYNYYVQTRHKIFHFGDVIGETDNTYLIKTKNEADTITRETLTLINNSVH